MSKEIAKHDAASLRIKGMMELRDLTRDRPFDAIMDDNLDIAPTIVLARRHGGVGASLACLQLEWLFKTDALIIEAGGNSNSAFRQRLPENFIHIPACEGDLIECAVNARFAAASRLVIIECAPAHYKETLDIFPAFAELAGSSHLVGLYIAGAQETSPKYPVIAESRGIGHVKLCRQANKGWREPGDEAISLPWFGPRIIAEIFAGERPLEGVLTDSLDLWSAESARREMQRFARQLVGD